MRRETTESGFTIIELMIVVLILTILTAIAVPVYLGTRARASETACYANERVLEVALERERSSEGSAGIADYAGLIAAVVPSEVATEPSCPSDGVYTLDGSTVRCTVHGTYHR